MKMFQEIQTEVCMCRRIKRLDRKCLTCGATSAQEDTAVSIGPETTEHLSEIANLDQLVTITLTRAQFQSLRKKVR